MTVPSRWLGVTARLRGFLQQVASRHGKRLHSASLRRGVFRIALAVTVAALVGLGGTASALAARVLVLSRDGQVRVENDPFLTTPATPIPAGGLSAHVSSLAHVATDRSVRSALARLSQAGAISSAAYHSYLGIFNGAVATMGRLRGIPAYELGSVIENVDSIAARGQLGPARLPAVFLTLSRNQQWWSTGRVPSTYQRVQFAGSPLTWEYYPGQGMELQELANFSTAAALCNAGPRHYQACGQLLSQLIPLASSRAGGMTWEYYFQFDGGIPPWTSAMSQGTALEALAAAYRAFHNPWYLTIGNRALTAFTVAPPRGVAVKTSLGARYVQYTFDASRGDEVINAFLQSLIGLDEYAQTSGNPLAARLFAAGNAEAQAEVPDYDTGAWSLYQPGIEDDLSYHELVTGFLHQLCGMTKIGVYCTTAQHFSRYLKTPPVLTLLTTHLARRKPGSVYFQLSKVSRVGITLLRGAKTVFLTSASFPYGRNAFAVPPLAKGSYTVHLDATDLAGNYGQTNETIRVS